MEQEKIIMTPEGYKKCKKELLKLHQEVRPKIVEELRVAYDFGDLRENAEFDYAKESLRKCEEKIKFLEHMLHQAEIEENKDENKVSIGSTVTIEYLDSKEKETFQIVNSIEMDIKNNKISNLSPVGKSLYNAKLNDIITITTPLNQNQVKIIQIKH